MAYSQGNNLSTGGGGQQISNRNFERRFQYADILFYKPQGVADPNFADRLHFFHQICSVRELSNISGTVDNERETIEAGKDPYLTNDGVVFEATLALKSDDIMGLNAMLGRAMRNTSTTGVDMPGTMEGGIDYGVQGDLVVFSAHDDDKLTGSQILTDVEIAVYDMPGNQNGDNTRQVRLRSRGRHFEAGRGFVFVPFMFYDDGTGTGITNAAAPNGILTTFNLKDANFAWSGANPTAPLLAQQIDPDASGAFKYILNPRINGAKIAEDAISFVQSTGVISFSVAPADGAKFEGVILVPTGFEDYNADYVYGTGMIVKQAGVYYVCSAASGTTTGTFAGADWTALTAQTFPVPLWYTDNLEFGATSTWQYPLHSWLEFNLR